MEPFELLQKIAAVCEQLRIRYVTVGSLATIAYGEPRYTNDIDVVIDLRTEHLDTFCAAFPAPEYSLSRAAAEQAIRSRRQFNVIHTLSALKVDCILPATDFDFAELARGVRKRVRGDFEAVFGRPEDVIIKKLEYYRLGGSDKHLRDVAGVIKISGEQLDRPFIEEAVRELGLVDVWQAVLSRLNAP
jgi:hypothetical protein